MKIKLDDGIKRIVLDTDPFRERDPTAHPIWTRGEWPARWIEPPGHPATPWVAAFRLRFSLSRATTLRVHVSADEQYRFRVDGVDAGQGPERGDPDNWFFDTYELGLEAGNHCWGVCVAALGGQAPFYQMSLCPGLIVSVEGVPPGLDLNTGVAPWEVKLLKGFSFRPFPIAPMVGGKTVVDGRRLPAGWRDGGGGGWKQPYRGEAGQTVQHSTGIRPRPLLTPALLPALRRERRDGLIVRHLDAVRHPEDEPVNPSAHLTEEANAWQSLMDGEGAVVIPPNTCRRVIVDLSRYDSVWPEVEAEGADAVVTVRFAEALSADPPEKLVHGVGRKLNRDGIAGRYMIGVGPDFHPCRRRELYDSWHWECGRYLQIVVRTGADALHVHRISLYSTGYPFEVSDRVDFGDSRMHELRNLAVHTLRVGTHDAYQDCPYYERLTYVGDARLEHLVTYVMTRDDRLPRKTLRLFDASRTTDGLTRSRYPSRIAQVIPTFSLWWIAMVYDYAMWRNDPGFVRGMLPGIRTVLDAWERCRISDGRIAAPAGWNFVDWTQSFDAGMPPAGDTGGVSAIHNWHYVYTLGLAAELEQAFGRPDLANSNKIRAEELARACEMFYAPDHGLYGDTQECLMFSEHAQALAVLSGCLESNRAVALVAKLAEPHGLSPATIYFSHYVFEALQRHGRVDAIRRRLTLWFDLPKLGLTTTPEQPEPTRSDCHPWGTHPLYHLHATFAGVRPDGFGFRKVHIRPQLDGMRHCRTALPHPDGIIELDLDEKCNGVIRLPPTICGRLATPTRDVILHGGVNTV